MQVRSLKESAKYAGTGEDGCVIMTQCLPKDRLVGRHTQLEDSALQVRREPEERLALARRLCNAHTGQQGDKAAPGGTRACSSCLRHLLYETTMKHSE
jgi:hypothetical protein